MITKLLSEYICEALRFFGPMNEEQIQEKIALRELPFTRAQVSACIFSHKMPENEFTFCRSNFKIASGFEIETYKI